MSLLRFHLEVQNTGKTEKKKKKRKTTGIVVSGTLISKKKHITLAKVLQFGYRIGKTYEF
jgi:hypothetical protein